MRYLQIIGRSTSGRSFAKPPRRPTACNKLHDSQVRWARQVRARAPGATRFHMHVRARLRRAQPGGGYIHTQRRRTASSARLFAKQIAGEPRIPRRAYLRRLADGRASAGSLHYTRPARRDLYELGRRPSIIFRLILASEFLRRDPPPPAGSVSCGN